MKQYLPICAALLLLSACETNEQDKEAIKAQAKEDLHTAEGNAARHTTRVASNVRDQIKKTSMKLREWWLTPLPEPVPTPVSTSYCYHVLQDIACYRAPLPGASHRLVGYQGEEALPPEAAQTRALPASRIPKQSAAAASAARVASAKPVFVGIPVQPKEDKTVQMQNGVPQPGSEPLPDPRLSPQL